MPTKNDEWKKLNTKMYGVRIQNNTGIPDALEKARAESNMTVNAYIIDAIREKLQNEGYWKPDKAQVYAGPHGKIVMPE